MWCLFKKSKPFLLLAVLLMFWLTGNPDGSCKEVERAEAVKAADLWYAMEVNADHVKMDSKERAQRLARIGQRKVSYLVSKDDLREKPPEDGKVMAYVVEYKPTGYVIVTAEDRIKPVLAFGVRSRFRFDKPDRNFMRHFLATALVGRWEMISDRDSRGVKTEVHRQWSYLRARLKSANGNLQYASFGPGSSGRGIHVELDTPLWDQGQFYNDTVMVHNGGIQGIPTGCTATAMAIKMRHHEWPTQGYTFRSYSDIWGLVQYNHFVDFGNTIYDWSQMPMTSLTQANLYVALLMYHSGVCTSMNYEVGNSTAWLKTANMDLHFRYKGTMETTLFHEVGVRKSVIGGLPTILSSHDHTVVCDGYRDSPSPYFRINVGYNGAMNDWYDISMIPGGSGLKPIARSYPFSCPQNYFYVDLTSAWSGNGLLNTPFLTLAEGNAAVPEGGKLWVYTGTYTGTGNTPIVFDKQMEIKPYGGGVVMK